MHPNASCQCHVKCLTITALMYEIYCIDAFPLLFVRAAMISPSTQDSIILWTLNVIVHIIQNAQYHYKDLIMLYRLQKTHPVSALKKH